MNAHALTNPQRLRGDAILAAMQAGRTYAAETAADPSQRSNFDAAHAIVDRLIADGFIDLDAATGKVAA